MSNRSLPHLNAAIENFTTDNGNMCVQRSAALVLDLPGAELVFGVVRAATAEEQEKDPRASKVPFIHAWVEWRGELYAPTLVEKLGGVKGIPIAEYYRVNGVKKTWRLSHEKFMKLAKDVRLGAAFKHGKKRAGAAETADMLLRAAGVEYRLSERRTLLPLED